MAVDVGVNFVPVRALALYGRKRSLVRIGLPDRFERELLVVGRRQGKAAPHLEQFIGNILF